MKKLLSKQGISSLTLTLATAVIMLGIGCKKDKDPCNQPSTLTTSNVTATTAQLNWLAASPTPDAYEWQVVPSGNQPGTGTVVSGNSATLSAQATTLTSLTDYDFYVRSSCGGSVSGWAGPGAFTTIAGSIEPPIYLCHSFGTSLTADLVLVDRPNAPVDYVIDCVLRVESDLTIQPGVVIEMGADAGLYIRPNGTIDAVGTATQPISFSGVVKQKGYWGGIAHQSTSVQNEISYVEISHAGGDNVIQGGPLVSFYNAGGVVKFTNNTIAEGLNIGIYNFAGAELTDYANNTVTTHNEYPVKIHANDFWQLDGTGSSYTGNTKNMVEMQLSAGSVITVTTDQTWMDPGVPVIIEEGTLGIRGALEISPGMEFVCRPDLSITLNSNGSFNAEGTAALPIIFRGEQSIQGYWNGIYLDGTSVLTKLDHVTISDAGREKPFGAAPAKANLYISSGTTNLVVSNCTISNSLECGIYTSNAGVTLTNITYNNNAGNDVCP